MGYFSNGSEADDYQERYCVRCVHDQDPDNGCAIWLAHLLRNYDECNNKNSILHMLIPREGIGNGRCRLFAPIGLRVLGGEDRKPLEADEKYREWKRQSRGES